MLGSSQVQLAPMVGLSHFVVRKAVAEFLPAGMTSLWPTEMLSSKRLCNQNENQVPELFFYDKESGLCPQVLGNEEVVLRKAVQRLTNWGARAIDINMGCPVKQALKHNYGVALMGDIDYAARVTECVVKQTRLPVSVKLRAGLQKDPEFLLRFAKALENAGASWLTLHPRSAVEKRRGTADWSQIKLLVENLKIPIIGNGDLECVEDIEKMIIETGCSKVMLGRALLAKPWLIAGSLAPRLSSFEQSQAYGRFLKRVLELSKEWMPEEVGLRKIRFLLYHSCVWLDFGHFLYSQVKNSPSYAALEEVLESFFSEPREMRERTGLRH